MANIFRPPCDEGIIVSGRCSAPCTKAAGRWVLAATIIGSSMVFIDGAVVNVALPQLQKELHATISDAQWVVESYALFLAALILLGGSLGDHLGRRRVFTFGIALFALASVACGFSQNVSQLIAARAVQGVGGAMLVPGSLAIISASFAAEQRGKAIGVWSGFTAISSGFGPVLGGWLIEHLSWRWAFWINAPLAIAVLGIASLRVPESRDNQASARLDWTGAATATVGLGAIVYGLIESGNRAWTDPVIVCALVIGVVALTLFALNEARSRSPMMPLTLFRARTFSGANVLTLLLYAALGGALFFLPFNLIQVQGYRASEAGTALVPFILIMFLLSHWAGGLVERYGSKPPLIIGPLIAAVGFTLLAAVGVGGSYWSTFFPAVVTLAIGMAIAVAPLTTTVMNSVAARYAGVASGINNAVARTAGLMAIALFSVGMQFAFDRSLEGRLADLRVGPEATQRILAQRVRLAGAEIPDNLSADERATVRQALNESFVSGWRLVMLLAAGLAVFGALSAWVTIEGRVRAAEES